MKNSRPISALRRDFRQGVLDFLWRQWVQLGVSGALGGRDRWSIDPEALLIYSLKPARRDPRLFDEILDWLVVNGSLLSTQRLRNLLDHREEPVLHASLAWAAAHGAAQFRTWQRVRPYPTSEPQHILEVDGQPLLIENRDPIFESFGLLRPLAERSGKSQAPDPSPPANLAVRLRLLFGVGARAEIIRFLLTAGEGVSTRNVADAAAYARRNIADALTALETAGVIASVRHGRVREWRTDRAQWASLFGLDALDLPRFIDWSRLFRAMEALDLWLEADAAASDYLRTSTARRLLESIHDDLMAASIRVPAQRDAATALACLDRVIEALLEFLGS